MIQKPSEREAEWVQANRKELVERIARRSCTKMAGITGQPLSRVGSILRTCRQYLTGREPDGGAFRLYHESFRDFLLANNEYPVYPVEANQAIARYFLTTYQDHWHTCQELYLWQHLTTHLVAAGRHEELRCLLVNFDWLRAKLGATDINALLADYGADKELASDPHLQLIQAALHQSAHVLARDPTQLPGQLVGRLLTHQQPVIQALLAQIRARYDKPWLCPRFPSLTPAGGPLWCTLEGHTDWVVAVAIADGRVISGSKDHTLRVWELATGECLHVLRGHSDEVWAVAIADDRVVSGSADTTLRVWDLASGREVTRWEGETAFRTCDASVLDTDARDNRPSLLIAAGDAGGRVHCLQLLGDRDFAPLEPK